MVNLTQIMPQKDNLVFAELLNRIYVKQKTEALSDHDRAMLGQSVKDVKDCPPHALRIFATNKEVELHNATTLTALHNDAIKVEAMDFFRDADTGELVPYRDFKAKKRDLPDAIHVAEGVRIMVLRNLDFEDGIVNEAFAIGPLLRSTGKHSSN